MKKVLLVLLVVIGSVSCAEKPVVEEAGCTIDLSDYLENG